MKNITKEKFDEYERVRQSGATNMFDVRMVCNLSWLSREEVLSIMNNYGELEEKFA
jgi:hypothetical protein